jgi:hypothetical protein
VFYAYGSVGGKKPYELIAKERHWAKKKAAPKSGPEEVLRIERY